MGSERGKTPEVADKRREPKKPGREESRQKESTGSGSLGLASKLKCICTNVDSLFNKRAELAHILVNNSPDILLISEVLPKNFEKANVNKAEISFNSLGYDCFTNCLDKYAHLGVAINVKSKFNAQTVTLSEEHRKAKESIWVEMPLVNSDKLLVGSVYRPPSNSKEDNEALYNTILSLIEGRSHVLL